MNDLLTFLGLILLGAFCGWVCSWSIGSARTINEKGTAWHNAKQKEVHGQEAEQIANGLRLIAMTAGFAALLAFFWAIVALL